ncbi:hypothetical protein FRB99_001070 [Tulasnella sp. 403]|nr:hypothetical protein FRB99_001070 [Tulasnella sp. 403]
MPQQTDYAKPVDIANIGAKHVGCKLRVAGIILCYDEITHLLLLSHKNRSLAVDLTLCLDPTRRLPFLLEDQAQIMVIGHLEKVDEPVAPPLFSAYLDAPEVALNLVLRAILVKDVPNLDLNLWNEALTCLPTNT